jgi:hypothetical protein
MFARLTCWIKSFLRNSSYIHVRQSYFSKPTEVIELIDRFIYSNVNYPLEWDDFISWENDNPSVEELRKEIGKFDHLLFQRLDDYSRLNYSNKVIEQRNILASKLNLPVRPLLTMETFLNLR